MLSFFKKHSTITAYFLLTILALQILRGFFQPGIFNSYDTLYRLARTAKYYLALREGQLLPRWIGDVDSGVGSPIFTYLYPFPYLVTTIFHLLKFNLMDAQKIPWMIFLSFQAGVCMHFWCRLCQNGLLLLVPSFTSMYRYLPQ